jgi:hypothetical protein
MDIDITNMKKEKNVQKRKEETQEFTTKIKLFNPSLLEISDRIKKRSKDDRYDIVMKYDFVTILEKNGVKQVATSRSPQKYVILYHRNQHHVEFYHFLFECLLTPKLLVLHIIRSYETIIESLLYLEEMKISFSNFSTHNLVFDRNSYLAVLTGFDDSCGLDDEVNNDEATEYVNELYLNIIQTIVDVFSLEDTLLRDLCMFIIENGKKKENLLSYINELYRTEKWEFVKEMKQVLMKTFQKELLDY